MSIEQQYVHDVYDNIAEHFSDTRYCIWDFVKNFLENKSSEMKGIDIGCGNGKNMLCRKDLNICGLDTCHNFIIICKRKSLDVKMGNCTNLPYQDEMFDYAMSIAVYHHLSNENGRVQALNEMLRVLKKNGEGLFSVWSVENQEGEKVKRNFTPGDNYVKWMRKSDGKIFSRYYYVYNQDMIKMFMQKFSDRITNMKIFNERGNWVVQFVKK